MSRLFWGEPVDLWLQGCEAQLGSVPAGKKESCMQQLTSFGVAALGLALISGVGIPKGPEVFGSQAGDDCAGIAPKGLPDSTSVVIPHPEGRPCNGSVSVDGQGNVLGGSDDWTVFRSDGTPIMRLLRGSWLMPQPIGFHLLHIMIGDPWGHAYTHRWVNPDGLWGPELFVGGEYCYAELGRNVAGGSFVLTACRPPDRGLHLRRFDPEGHLTAQSVIADSSHGVTGTTDLNGLTFVVFLDATMFGFGPDDYAARWYDEMANPVTDYFLLFTAPGDHQMSNAFARPLIGGGVAVQIQGDWVAISPSGLAESLSPPEWLASRSNYDIEIVRGGRAHALIPKWPVPDRSTIPLYSASGNHCADVTFPLANVTVGMDGTAISVTGEDLCTMTWWPQVLP